MKGRKIIAALSIASALSLTACDSTDKMTAPDLSGDIGFSATISCGGFKASADISRNDGVWKITCTAPDSINGMEIVTNGTERKVTGGGIVFDYNTEDVPFVTAFDYFITAVDSTENKDSFTVTKGTDSKGKEETRLQGTVLSSGYQLTIDKDGNITSFSAGDYKFTAVEDDKKES